MIRACIFDLDGVIIDTAHYHFLAWKRLAEELGVPFSEKDNERLKGVSRNESLEIILDLGNISLPEKEKKDLMKRKNDWFIEYVDAIDPGEVFPGVVELITTLKTKGIKIALASSSKNAMAVIRRIKLEHLFEVIVDGNMISNTKPNPEIFLTSASRLHLKPDECLVFEDAQAGVEAAINAGMKCVGVGSAELLGKAHAVIRRTADFKIERLSSY